MFEDKFHRQSTLFEYEPPSRVCITPFVLVKRTSRLCSVQEVVAVTKGAVKKELCCNYGLIYVFIATNSLPAKKKKKTVKNNKK